MPPLWFIALFIGGLVQVMRTIKEILHTADGIGDKPMRVHSSEEFDNLVIAAEHVIATAFGNTYGMTVELQLEALRSASVGLQEALESLDG